MLEARDIHKSYGPWPVLASASLGLEPGRPVLLSGDNGSGKTTLLHVLVGLRCPDAGEVVWKGTVLTGAGEAEWGRARGFWGFLPQRLEFPQGATVERLLRFHGRIRGVPNEWARDWLERVGLGETAKQRVHTLSGGMQQRLGIALTFFHRPEVVLMDEPSASLDPEWRRSLGEWVGEAATNGAAVLVTSQLHEPWHAGVESVRCVDGRVVDGSAADGGGMEAEAGAREPRGGGRAR